MRVEKVFWDLQERVKSITQSIKEETKEMNDKFLVAKKNTDKFLKECERVWIKVVSLWTKTDLIPRTITFPFGVDGSIFAEWLYAEYEWRTERPAIWSVASKFEEWHGCWNGWQHSFDLDNFIEWVYEFKKWCWKKVW